MAVAAAYIEAVLAEAERHGVCRAELLALLPGSPPVEQLGSNELALLCRHAIDSAGQPALGLLIGQRLNLASHGLLGYALMSSRNGHQVLALLQRYAALALPGVKLERLLRGPQLWLACRLEQPVFSRTFVLELVVATLVGGCRALFNRPVPGAEIWFDYPPPDHAADYRRLLKAPVRFGQPVTALVCERTFLELSVPSANPVLAEISARQCEALARNMRSRTGLSAQVRTRLLDHAGDVPDQAGMAASLGLGERTFRRRLAAEGIGYRDLVEEVRAQLAGQFLRATDLPVAEIGALLGYDDAANFRRACRRWFGCPPQAVRRQAVPGPATNDPLVGQK